MKNLTEVKAHCVVDGMHWFWEGGDWATIRAPDYTNDPTGRKVISQAGPRAVWHLKHRKGMPRGHVAFMGCHQEGCLSPHCVTSGSRDARGKAQTASGIHKGNPRYVAAARVRAIKLRKVTDDMAREIRTSTESGAQLEKRLGVDKTTINKWRSGVYGKTVQNQAGMWSGLM